MWDQRGSRIGTQMTLSSAPFSSRILNSATGFTGVTQPGKVGSEPTTRQSSGSPSSPRWPGRNP